jgi:hypothetical protein
VTVPPVTGVLIRALKVPETLPAKYSVVAFAETAIEVNAVQTIAPADPEPGAIGLFWGQHSIVIAPPVTDPLPVILNVTSRGSGKSFSSAHFTYEKTNSGQRESNPHGQLGRLELYH